MHCTVWVRAVKLERPMAPCKQLVQGVCMARRGSYRAGAAAEKKSMIASEKESLAPLFFRDESLSLMAPELRVSGKEGLYLHVFTL